MLTIYEKYFTVTLSSHLSIVLDEYFLLVEKNLSAYIHDHIFYYHEKWQMSYPDALE